MLYHGSLEANPQYLWTLSVFSSPFYTDEETETQSMGSGFQIPAVLHLPCDADFRGLKELSSQPGSAQYSVNHLFLPRKQMDAVGLRCSMAANVSQCRWAKQVGCVAHWDSLAQQLDAQHILPVFRSWKNKHVQVLPTVLTRGPWAMTFSSEFNISQGSCEAERARSSSGLPLQYRHPASAFTKLCANYLPCPGREHK